MIFKRIFMALAALTMLGGLQSASAPDAGAVTGYVTTTAYIGGGTTVNLRTGPGVNYAVARVVATGYSLDIVCQQVGGPLGFSSYASNRTWNLLANGWWVHDAVTTTPGGERIYPNDGGYVAFSVKNLPRCDANPLPLKAAAEAMTTVGQNDAATTGMRYFFSDADWATGPPGEWSYDCAKLVRAAYMKLGYTPRSAPTATALWQAFGSPRRTDTAPVGAFVFWPGINHVAISIGGGRYVSTMGGEASWTPNAIINSSPYGTPTGWAMP